MKPVLTPTQLQRLKEHEYRTEGVSVLERLVLRRFWSWLVLRLPPWIAPNLITLVGFVVTLASTLLIVVNDRNAEGLAPRWCYLFAAIGIFVYQTLDGVDGKQARRTGTCNPLGELFDHGCDAIATYVYVVATVCAVNHQEYPYLMLVMVCMMLQLLYAYHWQAYVSGVFYFHKFDVAEAQFGQIAGLLLTATLGPEVWQTMLPGVGISLKALLYPFVVTLTAMNLFSAYYVILTGGVGKNGSTVADTSVLSPLLTPLVLIPLTFLSAYFSPSHSLQTNAMLFMAAFCLPVAKTALLMMLAGMTKSPFPLLDSIMLGPLIAFLNVYFGPFVPETYLLVAVAVSSVDIGEH